MLAQFLYAFPKRPTFVFSLMLVLLSPGASMGSIETINIGVTTAPPFRLDGGRVAFMAFEALEGRDLNGDGDTVDTVLHVFDASTHTLVNLGLSCYQDFQISGDRVAFLVGESSQGETDLNGDDDTEDQVLHLFDFTLGTTFNTGYQASHGLGLNGKWLAFTVYEPHQGDGDLNGDGDVDDKVVHIMDATTRQIKNLGLVTTADIGGYLDGDRIAIAVPESLQGSDLNGDGDMYDNMLHVYDASLDTVSNLKLNFSVGADIDGDRIAFGVSEYFEATDLNGDLDTDDDILHIYNIATGTTINVGHDVSKRLVLEGEHVAFLSSESNQFGKDLNGDRDTEDFIVHVYHDGTGIVHNVGIDGSAGLYLSEGRVGFVANEYRENRDLNHDGDLNDTVPFVYDGATTIETGLASSHYLAMANGQLVFVGYEMHHGSDLNGDGDTSDLVLHIIDKFTNTVRNMNLAVGGHQVDEDLVVFTVSESGQAETDLNGDGDSIDWVLHLLDLRSDVTLNTGLEDLSGFALSGRWVAFPVSEARQGNVDLNGDGDTTDWPLHIIRFISSEEEEIEVLIDDLISLDLHDGTENSLVVKLEAAIQDLVDGDVDSAIDSLQSFINQVKAQRGKKISEADADALIAAAQAIIDRLL